MFISEFSRAARRRKDSPAPTVGENFRPDVQALRAVAVGGVLFYHLWPKWLVGGFVGVDVFYVISGYLITQHLMREVKATGRISLTKFWARRIRRLFPAAFTVLAACAALLLLFMPRLTWSENVQEVAASALYFENWLLGFNSVDYLASADSASIVQHYWSLSVEEQFYIVWPLLLLGAVLIGRRVNRLGATTAAVIALAAITAVSLAASIVDTARSPAFAFFATYTRAWEFGLGGLVALTALPGWLERRRMLHVAASWSGFALIAVSMLVISEKLPFPGWVALLPTVGAAVVLRSNPGDGRWSPMRATDRRWIQWTGDCSYSIYLWHWPLIIAAPWVLGGSIPLAAKLVIFAATLWLAGLSKRYIEDPVRMRRSWMVKRWPNYAFAAAGMAVTVAFTAGILLILQRSDRAVANAYRQSASADSACFGAAALSNPACPQPFRRPSSEQVAFAVSDLGPSPGCQTRPHVAKLTFCEFGEIRNPKRTIVVVGNSHALRLVPALEAYGARRGWKILLAAKTDCMGLSSIRVGTQSASNTCLPWSANVRTWILAHRPSVVVFASHLNAQVFLAGTGADAAAVEAARRNVLATWDRYARAGIPVVVAGDVPGTRPQSAPECIARSSAGYDPCALPRTAVLKENLVADLARTRSAPVTFVPLTSLFCDARLCHSVIGGVVVYSDRHHVTDTYSQTMAPYLGSAVDKAMSQRAGQPS